LKGPSSPWTEAIDQEVRIEGKRFVESQALHHGEARAVDEAETLIGKRVHDVPGRFQVDRFEGQYRRSSGSQSLPKCERGRPPEVGTYQRPRFGNDEIRRDEARLGGLRQIEASGRFVMPIGCIRDRIPGSRINQHVRS
jgi:hypothetical protein